MFAIGYDAELLSCNWCNMPREVVNHSMTLVPLAIKVVEVGDGGCGRSCRRRRGPGMGPKLGSCRPHGRCIRYCLKVVGVLDMLKSRLQGPR